MLPPSLADIQAALGGTLHGDPARRIERISPLASAGANDISFLSNPRYRAQMAASDAGCVIVSPETVDAAKARGDCIETPDPYLYYARLSQWWAARVRAPRPAGVHPSAVVDADADVDPSASVGALCTVEAGAVVGPGCRLEARVHLGTGARVGAHSRIGVGVTIGAGCSVGERAVLHPGVVIGADGFGFALSQGGWHKIEQLGGVQIGCDVEIGANTCIDRGALGDTVIGNGVKLDNLIQIGHNVQVGAHTAMAGCVGVAGSAVIGARCTLGGGAIVLGHLELVDDVHVSAATVVTRSIREPGQYSGVYPFEDNAGWERNAATLRRLHELRGRVRDLEKNRTP